MKRCAISSRPVIGSVCAVALWPKSYINSRLFPLTPHGGVGHMKAPPPGLTMSAKGEQGGWRGVVHPLK